MGQQFMYPSEKLNDARRALMAPHGRGEAASFASAFELCDRAFHHLDLESVDDPNVIAKIETIRRSMDTTGLEDNTGQGLWMIKADKMSYEEKVEFSNAVDDLASWLDMKFYTI